MGVKGLWTILEPCRQEINLELLKGLTLAVDLSIWIVESKEALKRTSVIRPHLRNLFFRIYHLLKLGIKLIFAIEGIAPKIKNKTINKRLAQRGIIGRNDRSNTCRSSFNKVSRDCCEMLECLGIPYVQSYGEAEAMCSYLEMQGIVDGCITNDGDALLYGAKTIYRNFNLKEDSDHTITISRYRYHEIERGLQLNRERMVALALLLGCDYTKGISGVGKSSAIQLLNEINGSVLKRFTNWRKGYDPIGKVETKIKGKCLRDLSFPCEEIINEYLITKDKNTNNLKWTRPNFFAFNDFTYKYMDWVDEYSEKKIIKLLSYYDLLYPSSKSLQPIRIIKRRIAKREKCFEIEWKVDGYFGDRQLTTIDPEYLVIKRFPEFVKNYLNLPEVIKAKVNQEKRKNRKDQLRENKENNNEVDNSLNIRDTSLNAMGPLSCITNNSHMISDHINDQEDNDDKEADSIQSEDDSDIDDLITRIKDASLKHKVYNSYGKYNNVWNSGGNSIITSHLNDENGCILIEDHSTISDTSRDSRDNSSSDNSYSTSADKNLDISNSSHLETKHKIYSELSPKIDFHNATSQTPYFQHIHKKSISTPNLSVYGEVSFSFERLQVIETPGYRSPYNHAYDHCRPHHAFNATDDMILTGVSSSGYSSGTVHVDNSEIPKFDLDQSSDSSSDSSSQTKLSFNITLEKTFDLNFDASDESSSDDDYIPLAKRI